MVHRGLGRMAPDAAACAGRTVGPAGEVRHLFRGRLRRSEVLVPPPTPIWLITWTTWSGRAGPAYVPGRNMTRRGTNHW